MARFVDVGGCAVPTAADMHLAVEYVMRRVGVAPTTVYRGNEPEARAILNRHGKHTQQQLWDASPAQRAAWGVMGVPNPPGQSTHEMRAAGIFGPPTAPIPAFKVGQDWPPEAVPAVIRAYAELGCDAFRPYPTSANERQHICCRRPPRFTMAQRLYVDPLGPGDKGELVRGVQILMRRGGFYRGSVAARVGTFGPALARAVKRFQGHVGLPADGVWGPKTDAAARRRWGRDR